MCSGGACSWQCVCTTGRNPYAVGNGNTSDPLAVFTSPAAQPQQQSLSEVYQQLAQKNLAEAQAAEARARAAAIYASPEYQAALAAEQKRQQEVFDKLWSRIAELERNRDYSTAIRQTKVALHYFPRNPSLREELKQLKHEAKDQKRRPS